jgi:hypothetical protein
MGRGILKRHHHARGGIPQERAGENHAATRTVRREAEEKRPNQQSRECGGNEAGKPSESEKRRRSTGKHSAADEAGTNVGSEKKIVKLKAAAEGKQQDELPDRARRGKPVEPGADRGGLRGVPEFVLNWNSISNLKFEI